MIRQVNEFLWDLLGAALALVALGIVAGLLFGDSIPFLGAVLENVTALAARLGDEGLVGLLVAGAIIWLFTRDGASPAAAPRKAPARAGKDDLKLISGIGPALERKLNRSGIRQFGQIAEWSAEDIAKINASLNFKGRIEREDWVAQARTLAAGGETAFSRRRKP